jgi:hypothetical protein
VVQSDEFSPETLEGEVSVASLEAMFGRNDRDTGGNVYEPDRAFNLVAVLASGSPAAKGMESHFFEEDIGIGIVHVGIPVISPPLRSRQTGPDAGSCDPHLQ